MPVLLTVPRLLQRRGVWITALIVTPILLLIAVYTYAIWLSDRRLAEVVAEISVADPQWRFWDIEASRKQYPDEENGGLKAIEVRRLLPRNWLASPRVANPPPGQGAAASPMYPGGNPPNGGFGPLGDKDLYAYIYDTPTPQRLDQWQTHDLRTALDRVPEARDKARALVNYAGGRIPVNWSPDIFSTLLPNIQDMREVANLLKFDAYLRAQDGDGDGAIESARAMIHVCRAIGDEELLISQLVRMAIEGVTLKAVERTLAQTEPSEQALSQMQAALEEEAKDPVVLYGVRGERGAFHEMMGLIREGKLNPVTMTGGSMPSQFGFLLAMTSRSSHIYGLRYYQKLFEVMRLPLHEQEPELKRLEAEMKSAPPIARMLLPAVQKCLEAFKRNQAGLYCGVILLAAERYRRQVGRWPDSLEALVPKYLSAVPTDPYDGKPLRLRRVDDGWAVYAVGVDRSDDHGNLGTNPMKAGTDWGYRLWDVRARRQAPFNPEVGPPALMPDKTP